MQMVDREDFDEEDDDEDYMVLKVDGGNDDSKPYYME